MRELLERTRELQTVERALAAARGGRGGVVLVQGPPGSGRTALLAAAAELARATGMGVRAWAAAHDEADQPYATAQALFGDLADVPSAAAVVAAGAASRGPLALVVDDVDRADAASLELLGGVARRVRDVPLILIAATDDGPAGHAVRRALAAVPGTIDVPIGPLSADAVAAIVRAAAPGADATACRACHAAAAGLPGYVTALAAHLASGGDPRTDSPPGLTRRLADALAGLGDAPRALAHALAVLGDDATWALAGRLADLPGAPRRAAADVLRTAAILDRGAPPAFAAPVVRAAVRAAVLPGAAASAHRRAAELLAEHGAGVERVAVHLAESEPDGDPWVWHTLSHAAGRAMDRRAPEAAAALLERALAEPPAPRDRAALLIDLGVAETMAFRVSDAVGHLRQAVAVAGSLEQRLEASVALVAAVNQNGDPERDLSAVLGTLEGLGDQRLREQFEAHLVNQARQRTSVHRATRPLARAVAARVAADVTAASAGELACAAAELTMAGVRADEAARLAAAALTAEPDPEPMRSTSVPVAIRCLAAADHLDEAAAFLDSALADGRAREAALEVTMLSSFRADVARRGGDLARAESASREAWSGGTRESWELGHPATTAGLVEALVDRGEPAEAEDVLARSGFAHPGEVGPDLYTSAMLLHARGRLRLAQGAAEAGIADLRDCGRRLDAHGEPNPALIAWRSTVAVAIGGAEGIALADEELRRARAFGARRAIGVALRATALLASGPIREARLREAEDVLRDSPARLEHARVLTDLGEALLAAGRRDEARDPLREAYETAHDCGAGGLATQVAAALRGAGARPRRPFRRGPRSLTASERRVCELAAAGLANRGIADALVVTVSTVEYHLASAYRKLGITSRRELAAALAGAPDAGSGVPPGARPDGVGGDPADGRPVAHASAELDGLAGEGAELDAEAPAA